MADAPSVTDKYSPLHGIHREAGAAFTDFAGWQMPVRYRSELDEHRAVRTAAGLFDLSHMAEISVRGPQSAEYLDFALAGKISAVAIGQAKYSLLLSEHGGVIDDVIVYRLNDTDFLVVANAGNRFAAAAALAERVAGFDVEVVDESDDYALIAVQGPVASEVLASVPYVADITVPLEQLKYYWSTDASFRGHPLLIARTGYTGEDGYELYIRTTEADALWRDLVAAGEGRGLIPAGLAARDTLRLEAGMPLYGHELGLDTFPVQAGLGRVVALTKATDFVGRAAVEAGPRADARVLVGLVSEGRRAGRAGYPVFAGDADGNEAVGVVTSGALSPTLGHPIAMAYVDAARSVPGTSLFIDVRGTRIAATVVTLPFYNRKATS